MGGCKCIMGSLLCLGILAAGAICLWQFGPWEDAESADVASSAEDLKAQNVCEGCCNLLASNCNLKVNEASFAMVHNAMSSSKNLFAGYNNLEPLEQALVNGYRGLMLDSCICDGSLGETVQGFLKGEEDKGENYHGFCHSSCDAGVRDPAIVFGNIKTFLETNKQEVLILIFEVQDNSLEQLYKAIDDSELDTMVYTERLDEWPTMQQMIDSNQRVLLFAHGDGIDQSCEDVGMTCPEGLFYKYDYFEQTNWNDDTCEIKGVPRAEMDFFLMNHWKNNEETDLPSQENAESFNTYPSLMDRITKCGDRIPNVIAVDFWSIGDVLEFTYDVAQKNLQ